MNKKPLYYYFVFLHHAISILGNSFAPFTPTDNITLNCGSSQKSQAPDGRDWFGDIGSKFEPSQQSTVDRVAPRQDTDVDDIPYMTARLSRSNFTYSFPVTPGRKFIRLYFYPAWYPDFNRSLAFFTVQIGLYSLLKNFSAALTADSMLLKSFTREFCVTVNDRSQKLNITFSPSSPDAYAFINGIEIVSMPTNLYGSTPHRLIPFVGYDRIFYVDNNSALETVYRLNVGGSVVSPMRDTGMFRRWADDQSGGFLSKRGVLPVNTTITINYTDATPPYTAPEEIYRTARTMGTNSTENRMYNLTWRLPVDSGFNYLIRLHFCEFQFDIENMRAQRMFKIYINNQTAEEKFDVIWLSGGKGIPIFKDYVVMMEKMGVEDESKRDIFIALHPNVNFSGGRREQIGVLSYSPDAILNGIEMFKINNSEGSLAGLNPEARTNLAPTNPFTPTEDDSKANKIKLIIICILSATVVLALVSLLCFIIYRRPWWLNLFKAKSSKSSASFLPEELCQSFTLTQILTATHDFDDLLIIGRGGFGNVYKGYIEGVDTMVAIKRSNKGREQKKGKQGVGEFETEIRMLSKLRHVHLVSLIGYCKEQGELILVYEYMINGTLNSHLYGNKKDSLPWKKRLEICIGAAKGLQYLHSSLERPIIHRDVKTNNILLDHDLVAKVSDFGLSKVGASGNSNIPVSTAIKGTRGYLDPEYARRGQLTEKSDVYSFGVVLFEVLCARKAVDLQLEDDQKSLANWVQKCIVSRSLEEIIDPFLKGNIALVSLRRFVTIAESCLRDNGTERPTMESVAGGLEFSLKLHEDAGSGSKDNILETRTDYIYEEISSRMEMIASQSMHSMDSDSSRTLTTSTTFGLSEFDFGKSGKVSCNAK